MAPTPAELYKQWVPRERQRAVLRGRVAARLLVDRRRRLPDFLVIGAQRCGTSSLYKWLERHPDVLSSMRKETEFFSYRYARGEHWYRAHFPSRWRRAAYRVGGRRPVTFEASPYYLFHPWAPSRAAALVPGARLIALLRNPVDRAYSHYLHMRRFGQEDLSFEDALAHERERLGPELEKLQADPLYVSRPHERHSYMARGRYAEQIEAWLAHFPIERLLVLRSEDVFDDPQAAYDRVLDFIGLRRARPREFFNASGRQGDGPPMATGTRDRLLAEFEPHNQRLAGLLGREFGWDA